MGEIYKPRQGKFLEIILYGFGLVRKDIRRQSRVLRGGVVSSSENVQAIRVGGIKIEYIPPWSFKSSSQVLYHSRSSKKPLGVEVLVA